MQRRCRPTPTETHTGPEGKKPVAERWLGHQEAPEWELGRAEKKKRLDLARDGPVALFTAAVRLGKR